jgi:hypothetical protein
MNIERVKQLRAFIAELPKSACDMTMVLARTTDPDTRDYISSEKMQERGFECGSVGCFKGWSKVLISLEEKIPYESVCSRHLETWFDFSLRERSFVLYLASVGQSNNRLENMDACASGPNYRNRRNYD